MSDLQLHYRKKYQKQLKSETIVVRVDQQEITKLRELENKTGRTRSDLIRQSFYDLFLKYSIK
ncbi:MAG: hypothetical protein RLZZ196_1928 [Bacteroidota bacterium]|jgi:hypothetical protein